MTPLPLIAPPPPRLNFRFALPPSLGLEQARGKAERLQSFLVGALERTSEVVVAASYEALARDLLSGKVDAAWAPPFVCARIEAMGVRVLVRGVRGGSSSYRAALICRKGEGLSFDGLTGRSAVWADRDSVGGYLLAMALLRSRGLDPAKVFFSQSFAGSYQAAVEQLLTRKADVTSVFAPISKKGVVDSTGLEEIAPGRSAELEVIAFTEEAPNDGVAVAVTTQESTTHALEKVLLALDSSPAGKALLEETFSAERFEPAPRMGYRALYRVALASL